MIARVLYTLLVGIPVCLGACTIGVFLCFTVVGLPAGITLIALGVKSLTIHPRPRITIEGGQR